jgi:hypothetical protein
MLVNEMSRIHNTYCMMHVIQVRKERKKETNQTDKQTKMERGGRGR